MEAGDLIEIEIEGIGILANTIVDEAPDAAEQESHRP